jgi:hypothetical protein
MQVYVEAKKNIAKYEIEYNDYNMKFRGHGGIYLTYWPLRKAYRDMSDQYESIKRRILVLKDDIRSIGDSPELQEQLAETRAKRQTMRVELAPLKIQFEAALVSYNTGRDTLEEIYRRLNDARAIYHGGQGTAGQAQKREFIMKCGADECRGFLSTAYKCGTCETWTCPDCLVVLGLDKTVAHTCAPDAVESAKTIRAETRPCPKCAARIFKIDGCDQMWCVVEGCNTAFSWNTGQIVTGVVHNPHYYEWLRRQGGGTAPREAGDIPCGGLPGFWPLLQAFRAARILPAESHDIERIHRMLTDFEGRLAEYPSRMPQLLNKEINVKYLMNDMTEAEWQRQLEFAEAKFNRKREIGQILQTLVTAGSDLMNQVANRCQAAFNTDLRVTARVWISDVVMPQLEELRVYTNQCFKDLAIRNHMAVPQVGAEWEWMPIRAIYRKAKATSEAVSEAVSEAAVSEAAVSEATQAVSEAAAEAAPDDEAPPLLMPGTDAALAT